MALITGPHLLNNLLADILTLAVAAVGALAVFKVGVGSLEGKAGKECF